MLLGGVAISIWRGPRPLLRGVFGFAFLSQLCVLALGLRTSAALFAQANFLFLFSVPFINGYCDAIWIRKVTPDIKCRLFARINIICCSCIPLAYVVACPRADRIFEPLMAADGLLAGSIGEIISVGQGRGLSLLFITMEVLAMLITVAAYRYPRLRFVEDELPDAI